MRMMMDFNGNNRGYAFVTFTNRQDARNAIKQLNNYEIRWVFNKSDIYAYVVTSNDYSSPTDCVAARQFMV